MDRDDNLRARTLILATAILTGITGISGCTESRDTAQTPDPSDRQTVEWTIRGLLSKSPKVRERAFQLCKRHWSKVEDHVRPMIDSPKPARRMAATFLFAKLGSVEDLPLLHKALADETGEVRLTAVPGIERLQGRAGAPLLVDAMSSRMKYAQRRVVLDVLVRMDPAVASSACLGLAQHEGWAQRRNAAQTMGKLSDVRTAKKLTELLQDPVWMVKSDAALSLAARGEASSRPAFLAMSKDEKQQLRSAAVRALGQLGQAEDFELVAHMARNDENKYVRVAATESLRGFPEERAFAELDAILKKEGEHRKVRFAAVQVLQQHESQRSLDLARKSLEGDAMLRGMASMITTATPSKD